MKQKRTKSEKVWRKGKTGQIMKNIEGKKTKQKMIGKISKNTEKIVKK